MPGSKWNARASAVAAAALVSLAGCGGGGNESGPPDQLSVSPNEVSVGMPGDCAPATGPTVFVFGGQPPYKLKNSLPGGMQLDKASLTYSGEGFTISFVNNVCMSAIPVTIEDDMGRLAQVLVSKGAQ